MQLIVRCFEAGLLTWFGLLAMIVAGRVLGGDIGTRGLLLNDPRDTQVAPERALSMSLFPLVIVAYAYTALHADVVTTKAMPPLSDNLLMLLTGGNGIYLAGKIARTQRRTP